MYILYNCKKIIIVSLFKIDTLNFTIYILTILTCPLTLFRIGGGGGGGCKKSLRTSFSALISTNVGTSTQNFLTFSFNPFVTLL